VFVQRPSGTFVEARYSDLTLPPISLSEAKAATRALHARGRREVDTRTLVRTAVAQRAIVENATKRVRPSRRRGMGSIKIARRGLSAEADRGMCALSLD